MDAHQCIEADSGERKTWKKCSSRTAALILGLLCLLLFVEVMALVFFSNSQQRSLNKEKEELLKQLDYTASEHSSVTKEKDELRKLLIYSALKHTFLTGERDKFRDQLYEKASQHSSVTKERDDLKKQLEELKQYFQHGWKCFGGSLYFISVNKKNWQQSRDDCLQRGADLMIINSKEEQDFSRSFQKVLWVGLTDRETEGSWKWVDGTPVTTSYWCSGEPNNYKDRDEDCGMIWCYSSENSLNDAKCKEENYWICERNLAP